MLLTIIVQPFTCGCQQYANRQSRCAPAIFAPVVAEIADQFLFLGVDGDYRLLFSQRRGHLGVDVAELRIPVGVAVALRGFAVALQTVARLVEQSGDQGATDLVTLRLQCLR